MHTIRIGIVTVLVATLGLLAPSAVQAAETVTINGQTRQIDGTDVYRSANYLVEYTPAMGATTGANAYGFEAAVVDGRVVTVQDGVGNMAIPRDGIVLSGHGTSRTWLRSNATVGATVVLDGDTAPPPPPPPPPPTEANSVTVGTQTHAITGTNERRMAADLIRYTPSFGATTGTNIYGFEAAVVDGRVTRIENGVGNMAIPANGYVLSGHGEPRTWLRDNATVGAPVTLSGDTAPPPPPPPPPPTEANSVTVGTQTHAITGTNERRMAADLIRYTPSFGATTGTNIYGFEAAVVDGRVTRIENGVGNMAIPANGYVLSGHGEPRTWLRDNATVGAPVTLSGDTAPPPPPPSNALRPDIGIRTLGQFFIANSGARKLLKFPAVTVNVGDGPLEIRGTRSSSAATDWVGRQVIYNSDGSTAVLPDSGATFYFASDGHSHWHIRDFDSYELWDASGTRLRLGEKHGFCFEDNTTYRNWVGSPDHPNVPTSPVYTHEASCGEGQPNATAIVHGLSVGWGDTYPSSLPDQAIDITGVPDGTYTVRVVADWQDFWTETNETNNSASAQIRISGNTVTLVSANDGL